jgi:succinylglutamic semialdehyde dehydrogenase
VTSHLISDQWREGTGPAFTTVNPATGHTLATFRAATADEVDAAVRAARRAFEDWAELAVEKRVELLNRFGELLKREKQSATGTSQPAITPLPILISQESGKPIWESLGEIDAMVNKIPLSIQAMRERRTPAVSSANNQTTATRYKPHGVAAVYGPFNFPGHLPNGHIVPALLAGNTVVFKPSELAPLVARRTAELWQEAGLPPGVLNLVQGAREAGQALAQHQGVDGIFFTGSVAGGIALNRAVADQPQKIVALEMGGNNPLVVWDVADDRLDAAVLLIVQSAYLTAGQRCSCARRLIVESGRRGDELIQRLIAMLPRIRIGPWTDRPEPFMGPLVRAQAARNALAAQQRLLDLGAAPIRPMGRLESGEAFVSPGVVDVTGVSNTPDEEIFAPLLQVRRCGSFDDAIAAANDTRFGLCAGLATDERSLYDRFFVKVRAGVINLNRPTTGASSALPFGGVGHSGNHRPSAYFAADYCSYPVASMEQDVPAMPAALPVGISAGA